MSEITVTEEPYAGIDGEPWLVMLTRKDSWWTNDSSAEVTEVLGPFATRLAAKTFAEEIDAKIGFGPGRPWLRAHLTTLETPFDVDDVLADLVEAAESRAGWDPNP